MKNKKGISLIALSVSVIVLITMLSVITISLIGNYNKAKKIEFINEIDMVRSSVLNYYSKNDEYPLKNSVLISSNNMNSEVSNQFLNEIKDSNGNYMLNSIDYEKSGLNTLKYGVYKEGENDIYVFSTVTKKVYYAKGIEIDGKMYYTLTSDIDSMFDNKSIYSEDGIIFNENHDTINQVSISVPKDYEIISIKAENVNLSEKGNSDSLYRYFEYNSNNSYTIVINYKNEKVDEKIREVRYLVKSNLESVNNNDIYYNNLSFTARYRKTIYATTASEALACANDGTWIGAYNILTFTIPKALYKISMKFDGQSYIILRKAANNLSLQETRYNSGRRFSGQTAYFYYDSSFYSGYLIDGNAISGYDGSYQSSVQTIEFKQPGTYQLCLVVKGSMCVDYGAELCINGVYDENGKKTQINFNEDKWSYTD